MNERETIRQNSLVPNFNIDSLLELLNKTHNLPGINAEVGVYKGGTGLLIAANSKKEVHLFDTFEGLPQEDPTIDTGHRKGDFNDVTLEHVQNLLKNYPNAHIHKGLFPQDTGHNITDKRFAFVYLDVDLYESTKDSLEFFYPRMVPGGVIVTDDYNWHATPGVNKAMDEFLTDKPEQLVLSTKTQAYFIKV